MSEQLGDHKRPQAVCDRAAAAPGHRATGRGGGGRTEGEWRERCLWTGERRGKRVWGWLNSPDPLS